MIQVGQKFSFGASYDTDNLFVAAKIFDNSGPSPEFIATVPMLNYYGNSYQGSYIQSLATELLINISVYTDDTYETFDTNYPQTDKQEQVVETQSSSIEEVLQVIYQILAMNGTNIGISDNVLNVQIDC